MVDEHVEGRERAASATEGGEGGRDSAAACCRGGRLRRESQVLGEKEGGRGYWDARDARRGVVTFLYAHGAKYIAYGVSSDLGVWLLCSEKPGRG